MKITQHLAVDCSATRLFSWVDDLANYPPWMTLVHEVRPVDPDGDRPAWDVELQAQVGPFTRSKRLRMVRTAHREANDESAAVFERVELDGKRHADWVLRATVRGDERASTVTMELTYGGNLWTGAVLQRVLDDEIRRGSEALAEVVSREPTH